MNTPSSFRHCGQLTRGAVEGSTTTSPSQALHWKWMIGFIKPVIVMLLLITSVEAQTLADVARQERQRQARLRSTTRLVVVESSAPAAPPADPAQPAAGGAKPEEGRTEQPSTPATAKPAPPPAPPRPDPAAEFNAQMDKLRARLRELQDQESSLQLQVSQITNQVFATITDPMTQQDAQTRLGETQQKLTGVRQELEQTRRALDQLQAQGPPRQ
jgi:hypothetical protein